MWEALEFWWASYRSKGHRHMHILFINWDNVKQNLLESSNLNTQIRRGILLYNFSFFFLLNNNYIQDARAALQSVHAYARTKLFYVLIPHTICRVHYIIYACMHTCTYTRTHATYRTAWVHVYIYRYTRIHRTVLVHSNTRIHTSRISLMYACAHA